MNVQINIFFMFACNLKDTLKIQDVMGGAWVF